MPDGPQQEATPPMRASDADRFATVRILQDAVVRGLLTADEASERMAAAHAAVHLRELPPLTADLPPAEEPTAAPGWRRLAAMTVQQVRLTLNGLFQGGPPRRAAVALLLVFTALVAIGLLALDGIVDGDRGGAGFGGDGLGDEDRFDD